GGEQVAQEGGEQAGQGGDDGQGGDQGSFTNMQIISNAPFSGTADSDVFVTTFEGNSTDGGAGSDIFFDFGKNTHTGGAGSDVFVFSVNDTDPVTNNPTVASTITDFNISEDYIYIALLDGTAVDSNRIQITQENDDTILGYDIAEPVIENGMIISQQTEWFARLTGVDAQAFRSEASTIFNPGGTFDGFSQTAQGTSGADFWIGATQGGQYAGGAGNDHIALFGSKKTVSGGEGEDDFIAYVSPASTSGSDVSVISDFNALQDGLTLFFGEALNPRGQGSGFVNLDQNNGNYELPDNAGVIIDTGNSTGLDKDAIKARLDNITNLSAGDEFLYIADDGEKTRVFTYQDNGDGLVQNSEIDPVVTLIGIESTQVAPDSLNIVVA
ncbi:MAG: hypothetical protein VW226_11180, partial [Rhodospirillaceae bacterium]